MMLVREIMHCKPGKVRPLVEKFLAMSKLMEKRRADWRQSPFPGASRLSAFCRVPLPEAFSAGLRFAGSTPP